MLLVCLFRKYYIKKNNKILTTVVTYTLLLHALIVQIPLEGTDLNIKNT